MRRQLAILVTILCTLSACRQKHEGPQSHFSAQHSDAVTIGIVSVVEHPSLDSARFGFMQIIDTFARDKNKLVHYGYQSANLSKDREISIVSNYIGQHIDIIATVGTSPTQTAKNLTRDIPIVFMAVTDPLGDSLVASLERPGGNITGASDLYPVNEQMQLIKQFFPKTKNVGFIYNKGETNSVSLAKLAEQSATSLGMRLVHLTADRTLDVPTAVSSGIGKIDVLVMPTDNTAATAVLTIGQICRENSIPFFSTELESVQKGFAIASTYRNYTDVGKEAGKIAVRILKGESPALIPVKLLEKYDIVINKTLLNKFHVHPDSSTMSRAILYE
ncbi:MAG: ABC transporter substrate-binding protein [Bacteroidota bacterium]